MMRNCFRIDDERTVGEKEIFENLVGQGEAVKTSYYQDIRKFMM